MATVIVQKSERNFQGLERAQSAVSRRLSEILPHWLYARIERFLSSGQSDKGMRLEEIRLRSDRNVYLTLGRAADKQNFVIDTVVCADELSGIFEKICDGSLYTYSESIIKGYVSVGEGIRVGVCGRASVENGRVLGVYNISALNIRIPHATVDLERGLTEPIRRCITRGMGVLVYSPPAEGKTTVLRSLCVILSGGERPMRVALVDSRDELSALGSSKSLSVDVLSGYPKAEGIAIATAFMNPEVIICDEIGSADEASAIASAQNCGVPLIASAHGEDIVSVLRRPSIRSLHDICAFGLYVGIRISQDAGFDYVFHSREEAERLFEAHRDSTSSF
ncbi:MAG: hypothetical protein J6L85_00870 [Clostridia bacterium]|nr:hypothetical protein [Clostridia bacterium]